MSKPANQILLWDTAADGTVSLSRNAAALKRKIIATRLIGGRVVVRVAEILEGRDYFYQSAVSPDGHLFHLMKAGWASLDLRGKDTLADRIRWKFEEKPAVVHQGRTIKSKREQDEIRGRCEERAELLEDAGWMRASKQYPIRDYNSYLNDEFRKCLTGVGVTFFGPDSFRNTCMAEFLASGIRVQSRGDLWELIEEKWAPEIGEYRSEFIHECQEELTLVSAACTARQFGGQISELRPGSFKAHSYGHAACQGAVDSLEIEILRGLCRIIKRKESQRSGPLEMPLAGSLFDISAEEFATLAIERITPRDQEVLQTLLYGTSPDALSGFNLVQKCASLPNDSGFSQKLDEWVGRRFAEMIDHAEADQRRTGQCLSFFIGLLGDVAAPVILAYIGLPPSVGSGTVISYAVDRAQKSLVPVVGHEDYILAGLRKPHRGKSTRT